MKPKVYFTDLRCDISSSYSSKISGLLENSPAVCAIDPTDVTAVKCHFGEKGRTSFIGPAYYIPILNLLREKKTVFFLTDTTTLYQGHRGNAVDHLMTACLNGFDYSVTGAPVIIADGLKGDSSFDVPVKGKYYSSVRLAAELEKCTRLVCVSHFKGHELAGFGGAIKNLGMGLAAKTGKLSMHSSSKPSIKKEYCNGCEKCVTACSYGAIGISGGLASISAAECSGCGGRVISCPVRAISIDYNIQGREFSERMAEHAAAAAAYFRGRVCYLNFLVNITAECDCNTFSGGRIYPDTGIIMSEDPVAADRASLDMLTSGADRFREIYPDIDYSVQLKYMEELDAGQNDYDLIRL